MLPPGHLAAGYLTAKALLYFTHQNFSPAQQSDLVIWGIIFGYLPDIDMTYSFFKEKGYAVIGDKKIQHRKFITHAPILWLVAGLLLYLFSSTPYSKILSLLFILATLSHFVLDSFDYGIMWLWPLNKKVFALRNREKSLPAIEGAKNIIDYLFKFLKEYRHVLTFYLEIIIIVSAIIIRFK